MTPYIFNKGKNITVVIGGVPKIIPIGDDRYERVVELILAGADANTVAEAAKSRADKVGEFLGEKDGLKIIYGHIEYQGKKIVGRLVDVIIDAFENKMPMTALTGFLKKVEANPDERARQDLYSWVEANNMPLTPDGDIIAYKMIQSDWTDHRTGKFLNRVGDVVTMPREDCDANPDRTCSSGLHGCGAAYLPNFASNGRVVLITVSPADMVAFPRDYKLSKFRCCEYKVIQEIPRDTAAQWFPRGLNVYPVRIDLPAKLDVLPLALFVGGFKDQLPLKQAFDWSTTPQGYAHWKARASGEVELDDYDDLYFRRLLSTHLTGCPKMPEAFSIENTVKVFKGHVAGSDFNLHDCMNDENDQLPAEVFDENDEIKMSLIDDLAVWAYYHEKYGSQG
jgi:hypothetical protein